MLFIPSAIPPHKRSERSDPIASAEQRLEWVELAIAGNEGFAVDRIEIDRPGRSYLVDTLAAIRAREPEGRPPVFIVGEDAFAEMGEWREPERLFELADFAVTTRPPGQLDRLIDRMPKSVRGAFEIDGDGRLARHRKADTRIELVPITALDISSSALRRARREGRSIRYLVPEAVRRSIEKSGCYASAQTGGESERAGAHRREEKA